MDMEIEVSLKNAWIHKPGKYHAVVYVKQNGNKLKCNVSGGSSIRLEDKGSEWKIGPWDQPIKAAKTFSFGDLRLGLKPCSETDRVELFIDLFEEISLPTSSTSTAYDSYSTKLRGSGCLCLLPRDVLHFKNQNEIPNEPGNGRIFIHSDGNLGGIKVNVGWISIVNQVKLLENSDEQELAESLSIHHKDLSPRSKHLFLKKREASPSLKESPRKSNSSLNKPPSPIYEDEFTKSTISNLFKAEETLPSIDAVRQILPMYHKLLRSPPHSRSSVKPYVNIEEPTQSKSSSRKEEIEQLPKQTTPQPQTLANGDIEKAKFLDSHVISVMEYQTKELDRYRLAVGHMGDVIVELRKEISELKIKNSQLRARVYYTDDLPLDDYEAEDLAVAGANTSQTDVLKRRLLSKTEELQQQRARIQDLQNSLIKGNEYEKKYLQLRKAHELQQSVLQELQTKASKYKLLEKTCKDQEKIIEELERQGNIQQGALSNGPGKRSRVHFEDSVRKKNKSHLPAEEESLIRSYQAGHSQSLRTKANFLEYDIEDRLTLLQKLEKAEGRIMALENQASKNARVWAKEKSQFKLQMAGDYSDTMLNRDIYAPPLPPLTDRADRYDSNFMVPYGRFQGMEMNPRYHYL